MKHTRKNNGRDKHRRHSYGSCVFCHPHRSAGNGEEKWKPSEARQLQGDYDYDYDLDAILSPVEVVASGSVLATQVDPEPLTLE